MKPSASLTSPAPTPAKFAMHIDVTLGCKHMNRLGVETIRNLIALAERAGSAD